MPVSNESTISSVAPKVHTHTRTAIISIHIPAIISFMHEQVKFRCIKIDRVTHTPKIVRKEMNYLYQDEVASLLSIESEWKPLWTLLIGTGLRIGESLGLQWKDIDESSQTLKITRATIPYCKSN